MRRSGHRPARALAVAAGHRHQPPAARRPRASRCSASPAWLRRRRASETDGPGRRAARTPPTAAPSSCSSSAPREASSPFDPDAPGVRDAVRRICRWLDGMPLAIELAAARVPVLGGRADRRAARARRQRPAPPEPDALPRATARCTTCSSGATGCSSPTSSACSAGSACSGGASRWPRPRAVCAGDQLDVADVLDLLARADRPLARPGRRPSAGAALPAAATVRQYAAAKLWDGPERPDGHAGGTPSFFSRAGRPGEARPGRSDQVRWLERLELEHDNLTRRSQWQLAESIEDGARLASLLWPFWYQRGYYREARMLVRAHCSQRAGELPAARARRRPAQAPARSRSCSATTTRRREHLQAALELIRRARRPARHRGRAPAARLDRARAGPLRRGSRAARAQPRDLATSSATRRGRRRLAELPRLRRMALAATPRRAEEPCAQRRWRSSSAPATSRAGVTPRQPRRQRAVPRRSAARARAPRARPCRVLARLGFQEGIAWSLHELAIADAPQRRPVGEYALMLRDALLVHRQLGDRWRVASVLEEIAGALLVRHDPELAAEMLAAADALREQLGTPIPPAEAADRDAAIAQLGRKLSAAGVRRRLGRRPGTRSSTASIDLASRRSTTSTPPARSRERRTAPISPRASSPCSSCSARARPTARSPPPSTSARARRACTSRTSCASSAPSAGSTPPASPTRWACYRFADAGPGEPRASGPTEPAGS